MDHNTGLQPAHTTEVFHRYKETSDRPTICIHDNAATMHLTTLMLVKHYEHAN